MFDSTIGWRFVNSRMPGEWTISLGETAEEVATRYGISREDQDIFALRSQQLAADAIQHSRFDAEIVPVIISDGRGQERRIERDEHPRPDTSIEKIRNMKPAFRKEGGTVTAGSSSGINDGASAVLLVEEAFAVRHGLTPMVRVRAAGVAGVSPEVMGIGPVPAIRKALQRAGLTVDDVGLFELNEAFASQTIACMRELGVQEKKVNVNGGAIALGHPLGASGARIVTTLSHEMSRRGERYGVAAMCVGVGQGVALVLENIA